MLSIEQNLHAAIQALINSGSESPSLDAAVLMCHILDKPRSYLLTWPEKELEQEQQSRFDALIAKRASGEPVAYIVGEREFWSLPLEVSTSTLIPRADTERLVELAIDKVSLLDGDILDLGTGTGAIALALATEFPKRNVVGIDLQVEAQQLATRNAEKLKITNAHFLQGSWFSPIEASAQFACVVSNPPYIDKMDAHLAQGDVRFEPLTALVAEEKGLADLRYIAEHARHYLLDGGWLLMEHGFEQGKAVRDILQEYGYQQITTEKDYGHNDRVTLGCWS
ncbi:peptide chain release factor N(5)-glutamine methyltransferase [Vibrio rumoiensis]|uniref:Release factor glutamine methyltransferase n=1 Tax=Vibrio rumoiensis 1S-45 TaxID=1188252 RepID=A0A1E5E416_9VIBR|nr:peptide chain release factor N(5)-glutamine methyltransferase [Vibrio rumoiensis]OEF27421.1 protein-(glutamine-N5) methyltransferase, release factor-specific [Vibrio rumoiensis 1S-45]